MKYIKFIVNTILLSLLLNCFVVAFYAFYNSEKSITSNELIINYSVDFEELNSYLGSLKEDEIVDFYYDYSKRNIIKIDDAIKLNEQVNPLVTNYLAESPIDVHNAEPLIPRDTRVFNFMGKGNYFPDMIEFHTGEYMITEGRFYTEEEIKNSSKVCLVTNELKAINDLEIGDKLRISYLLNGASDIIHLPEDKKYYEIEIIGFYDNNTNKIPTQKCEERDSLVLLPSTTLADLCVEQYNLVFVEYYMKDVWNEYLEGIERVPNDFYISGIQFLVNDIDYAEEGMNILQKNDKDFISFESEGQIIVESLKEIDVFKNYLIVSIVALVIMLFINVDVTDFRTLLLMALSCLVVNFSINLECLYDFILNGIFYSKGLSDILQNVNYHFNVITIFDKYNLLDISLMCSIAVISVIIMKYVIIKYLRKKG